MFNDPTNYESRLSLKRHRGQHLTPEEQLRLKESDKRFVRHFFLKLGIIYVIGLPIIGVLIYHRYFSH